ncbi:hypothetical protein KEM54_004010, partial [Ascosphaera aggregata]
GLDIPGEEDAWDFGTGASFYVDATRAPYDKGYKMYTYITEELPKVVFSAFRQLDSERVSISGHSMGGHGALTLFLKNPGKYKSVSAFAPIANPSNCPWGQKAFNGYFGEGNKEKWAEHDATELIKKWKGPLDILIDVVSYDTPVLCASCWEVKEGVRVHQFIRYCDRCLDPKTSLLLQGTGDKFYEDGQLLPENFAQAAEEAGYGKAVTIRRQPGYDHSYYTMATFADDHIEHAAKYLFAA